MKTSLRRRIWGRAVRPYVAALSVVTFAVAVWGISAIESLGVAGHLIAAAGFTSAGMLFAGWLTRVDMWMIRGLLLSTGVWAGVVVATAIELGWWDISTISSFCWAGASAGAWLLEIEDTR